MIRVSVSNLEHFRLICETDWASEAELVAKVRREPEKVSWQAATGLAIHKLLERDPKDFDSIVGRHDVGPYVIDSMTVKHLFESLVMPPPAQCMREVQVQAIMIDPPALVTGRLDLLWGQIVADYKCKFSPWDAADYDRSLQWRFYLSMTEAPVFAYNFLTFYEPTRHGELLRFKGSDILRYWRYPGMEAECNAWVRRFEDWATSLGLMKYLTVAG